MLCANFDGGTGNRLRIRMGVRVLFLIVLYAVVATVVLAQQGSTTIVGDVTDAQGGTVTGAKVTAADAASGVTRTTQTNDQGHYEFLSLQPGSYIVRVEADGFRNAVTEKVEALVSTTQRVNIKLELGTVSDTVTVMETSGATGNTTAATIGNAFESRPI